VTATIDIPAPASSPYILECGTGMSCSSRHLDPAPVPWPALKSRCHDDPEWETSVCDVMELGRSVWALWCGNGGHDLGASKAIQNGLS